MTTVSDCRCGRRWTGEQQAHCARCHTHFSTVRSFDRHQRTAGGRIICRPAAAVGLVPHTGPYGVTWRRPPRHDGEPPQWENTSKR